MNIDTTITIYNTALTQPERYIGKNVIGKKPWITKDVLYLSGERKDLNRGSFRQKEQKRTGKFTRGFKRH